ncbi:MAG: M24 family metallopeptidase [Acidobacteria bacterium]|nr:M24 family metallopeptidase [Acidobacteriota bacterium]
MFQSLQGHLRQRGLRALLVVADAATDPDLVPFAGPVHVRRCFFLLPAEGIPRFGYFTPMERDEAASTGLAVLTPDQLDVPRWTAQLKSEEERLAAALGQGFLLAGVPPGTLALGGHCAAGTLYGACRRLAADGFDFVPGHDLVRRFRKKKTEAQAASIRAAAEGTCAALQRVARVLAAASVGEGSLLRFEGELLTTGRLRREIAQELARHGLEQPDGNIVAAGADAGVPHTSGSSERRLEAGEAILVDLYPHGGMFADCTRTFCVGEAPAALREAHGKVLEALLLSHQRARPGVLGSAVEEEVRTFFRSAGYPASRQEVRGFVHGLGHGVGFELHEEPTFRQGAEPWQGGLEEGDVFTLEPGLYDPEDGWGVRLEDLVYLGPDGPENLTPLPYDLDPKAWSR